MALSSANVEWLASVHLWDDVRCLNPFSERNPCPDKTAAGNLCYLDSKPRGVESTLDLISIELSTIHSQRCWSSEPPAARHHMHGSDRE
jgi:hypothetical protein